MWEKVLFHYKKRYDSRLDRDVIINDGLAGTEKVYEMEYTPENVDKIFYSNEGIYNSIIGHSRIDTNDTSDFGRNLIRFYIKNESGGGRPVGVYGKTLKEQFTYFRNETFDSLYNGHYLSSEVKEESRRLALSRLGYIKRLEPLTEEEERLAEKLLKEEL